MLHRQRSRAFSLIEAAIVLGVIGVVIGGIWAGANAVAISNQKSDVLKTTLSIVQGVRNLYVGQTVASNIHITSDIVQAGIVSAGWVNGSGTISSPWNQDVTIYATSNGVHIRLDGMPKALCADLVFRMPSLVTRTEELTTDVGCTANIASPISRSAATTYCSSTTNIVRWNFSLRGGAPSASSDICS